MTPADLRAKAQAITAAQADFLNALCDFAEQAAVDYRMEFGAVTISEAMDLLSCSDTTIRAMVKDGRLVNTAEKRIALWSIHELLHKAPAQRRKKPALRAVGGRT